MNWINSIEKDFLNKKQKSKDYSLVSVFALFFVYYFVQPYNSTTPYICQLLFFKKFFIFVFSLTPAFSILF